MPLLGLGTTITLPIVGTVTVNTGTSGSSGSGSTTPPPASGTGGDTGSGGTGGSSGSSGGSGGSGGGTGSTGSSGGDGMVQSGQSVSAWKITNGETIYINTRAGSLGGTAWVDYKVIYVFPDGNAVLVKEPGFVAYTGDMAVGFNLRRKTETYSDPYPGP